MNWCLLPALLALGCAKVLGFQQGELGAEAPHGDTGHSAGALTSGAPIMDQAGASGGASDGGAAHGNDAEGPPSGQCGNRQLDGEEECDGDNLREATCASLDNGAGGRLRCTNCEYDLSQCYRVRSLDVSEHACAVLTNDKLKCWGANYQGQLGLGDTELRGEEDGEMGEKLPFVDLGARPVLDVSTGSFHTCALVQDERRESNQVVCWGSNSYGQLGQAGGDVLAPSGEGEVELGAGAVVRVAAGGAHTCALFESGRVKCWGDNQHGQLGLGHTQARGKSPAEMGDNLQFVNLGNDLDGNPVKIQAIAAGQDHTCALTVSGAVKCWGFNAQGVLGIGSFEENRGEAANEMGNLLPSVDVGFLAAEQLSAGSWHNCIIGTSSAKCWGFNGEGELGIGDYRSRGLLPEEMGSALPVVDLGPDLYATDITAGYSHTCAWSSLDGVKCWGANSGGQLGLGDLESRGSLPEQMGQYLPFVDLGRDQKVMSVHAGNYATCAILEPGRVKCWGLNGAGTLGAGHPNPVGVAADQMGDALPFVEL